jgi:hypothetical protein
MLKLDTDQLEDVLCSDKFEYLCFLICIYLFAISLTKLAYCIFPPLLCYSHRSPRGRLILFRYISE